MNFEDTDETRASSNDDLINQLCPEIVISHLPSNEIVMEFQKSPRIHMLRDLVSLLEQKILFLRKKRNQFELPSFSETENLKLKIKMLFTNYKIVNRFLKERISEYDDIIKVCSEEEYDYR